MHGACKWQRIGVGIVLAETFEIQEKVNVKKRRACDVARHAGH